MALSVSIEDSMIKMIIIVNDEKEIITEIFHPYVVTPLTRLFFNKEYGQKYKINKMIKKFNKYVVLGENDRENNMEAFKQIILEVLLNDSKWLICSKCDLEYKEKSRKFENINYIIPTADLCLFHKNK